MIYLIIADLLVLFHLLFILFVISGGFWAVHRKPLIWIHVPCAVWGMLIEFSDRICPLTPLEIFFREMAGNAGYSGGFINHYIMPVVYPSGLNREVQHILGIGVILINMLAYGLAFLKWMGERRKNNTK